MYFRKKKVSTRQAVEYHHLHMVYKKSFQWRFQTLELSCPWLISEELLRCLGGRKQKMKVTWSTSKPKPTFSSTSFVSSIFNTGRISNPKMIVNITSII